MELHIHHSLLMFQVLYITSPVAMTQDGLVTNILYLYTGPLPSLGEGDEKGKVMGIFRSLGALSRATGPFVACVGEPTGGLNISCDTVTSTFARFACFSCCSLTVSASATAP